MPIDPPPFTAPLTTPKTGSVTSDWTRWLLALFNTLIATPQILGTKVSKTQQTAAIPLTPVPLPSLTGGYYRVNVYLHVTTTVATFSVSVTIGWTEAGLPRSITGTAVTQATTGQSQSFTAVFAADQATAITYTTTYSSTPAGMAYLLGVVVEDL